MKENGMYMSLGLGGTVGEWRVWELMNLYRSQCVEFPNILFPLVFSLCMCKYYSTNVELIQG